MSRVLRAHGKQAALVVVLLSCLSTVAFGGGYRASQALLDDGAAWLVKGHTVTHVNGDTGRPDAEVAQDLATGRERLEVVRTGDGVYVVNNDTGTVTKIDTATMDPEAEKDGPAGTAFVAGGGRTYVVDAEAGSAQEVDPRTLQPVATVAVPRDPSSSVVSDDGTLWVLGRDGRLAQARDGRARAEVPAGAPGSLMTLVGGRPVVVDPDAATAVRWGPAGPQEPVDVLPLRGARPELAAAGPGSVLYLALEGSGELVAVNLDARQVTAQSLGVTPVTDLGTPAVSRSRIAVPDFTGHRLLLLDRSDLRVVARVEVPATSPSFQVTVQGDRFYATDPFRRVGVVVEPDGSTRALDKGEGRGVSEPAPEQPPTPPTPPVPTPPRTPPSTPPPVTLPEPPLPTAVPPRVPAAPVTPVEPAAPGPQAAAPGQPAPAQPEQQGQPGPVRVPDLVGQSKEQACAELERLGLGCRLEPTGDDRGGRPGAVVSTDPAEGTEVAAGTEVAVRHLGDTTVPDVVDLGVDEACAELERVGLACQRSPDGRAAPQGSKAFLVLEQSPAAGRSAPGGSRVSVVHHDKVTPDDYVGRPEAEACAALRDVGLRCSPQDAGSKAGRPEPVGQVVRQDPAAGSAALTPGDGVDTGDVVQVFSYTNSLRPVGSYTGGTPDAACAAAQNDGFTCVKEVRHPFRRPDVAYAQAPAAGESAESGSQVTVYYDDRTPSQLKRWKRTGDEVWVISADPGRGVPAGYTDLGQTDLGLAYPPSVGGQYLVPITAWQCSCGGHDPNHYYTTGARPEPASAWGASSGFAGHVFDANYLPGEMREVHRLARIVGSTFDWAYAAAGTGEYDYYLGQGFRDDGVLGWTWNP